MFIASSPSRIALVVLIGLLAGCGDNADRPWIAIEGGGFIFNYRIAEVFYGVSVKPLRSLAPGTVLEGEFENPAGGAPLIVRETINTARLSYAMRTPPLLGVKAGKAYRVEIRVLDVDGAKVLGRVSRTFKSDLDQSANPEKPLTIGPGYTPNPDAGKR